MDKKLAEEIVEKGYEKMIDDFVKYYPVCTDNEFKDYRDEVYQCKNLLLDVLNINE